MNAILTNIRPNRIAVVAAILALCLIPGGLGALTQTLIVDAYVQVSVFVAATLLLFYGAERIFKFDIGQALSTLKRWQIPIATLLGATPGCGGAIVVVAAYGAGNVSFGAVVGTLTATMGDAAFLLIAKRPDVAIVVLPLSLIVGMISGYVVDMFDHKQTSMPKNSGELAPEIGTTRKRDIAYFIIAIPGFFVGAALLGQKEINQIFGISTHWIALLGAFLGLVIWASSRVNAMTNPIDPPLTRMSEETSFISIWVISAYIAYEYLAVYGGLDIESMFQTIAPLLPLIAIVIGLIPGCGPQVLVTLLYVNGSIPFAALMGNAISNDGDALFPAIALNPRVAVLATIYSTIPALIVAYAFYFFAPNFLN